MTTPIHHPHPPRPPAFAAGGNWLLTSAAAKVDLARRLRAALHEHHLRLHATDRSPFSAAFWFCDGHFPLPALHDPAFLDQLVAACSEREIRVVLPTRDADLLYFAAHRAELEAARIWPLVSDLGTVETCLDKTRFHEHARTHRLPVLPRIEHPAPDDFPCFLRPRCGSAGAGAGPIPSLDALRALHGPPPWPDLLLQPLCTAPEYTIDALFDLDGSPVQWIARERIRVKAGESTIGRTVHLPALDALLPRLARAFAFAGPVTLQAFYSESNGPCLIEINPRFGGAAALGIEAGLDTPRRLVALAQGDRDAFLRPRPLSYRLAMLRYSQDVFLELDPDT